MPLSGHLTDPNYITQTPSGTLDNTALTLIQVLNLHRGLAVIYLNYSLFSISCSYEDQNDCQNLKKQFLSPSYCVILSPTHGITSLFLPLSCLFAIFRFLVIFFSLQACWVFVCTLLSQTCVRCHGLCAKHWRSHLVLCGYKAST